MPFLAVTFGPGIPDADQPHVASDLKGSPEAALNQRVKQLIQKLGEAIHESVSESEHIAGVVKNIRDQGFDVMLMLEATIGLNQVEREEQSGEGDAPAHGAFTSNDLNFLKSLRITVGDEAPQQLDLSPPAETQGDSSAEG